MSCGRTDGRAERHTARLTRHGRLRSVTEPWEEDAQETKTIAYVITIREKKKSNTSKKKLQIF